MKNENAIINWEEKDGALYKKFNFKDFTDAFGFMTQVAILSEKQDHHPTWTNTYNIVEIWLKTHDAGNQITSKDHRLAAEIEVRYAAFLKKQA